MPLHPREAKDLALAPVAAAIDSNLQRLRDLPADEIETELEIQLDRPPRDGGAGERAERVLVAAVRNVDLHGWNVEVTADHARLHLAGGSVTVDLGLSASILAYIAG